MRKCKFIIALLLLFLLPILIACGSSNTAKSDNWRVTVVSAKFEKNIKTHFANYAWQTADGLQIEIKVEYIGNDGKAKTPRVALRKVSDKTVFGVSYFSVDLGKDTSGSFLWGGEEREMNLKKGDVISDEACRLLFKIPESHEEFELLVGDVPPIKINP